MQICANLGSICDVGQIALQRGQRVRAIRLFTGFTQNLINRDEARFQHLFRLQFQWPVTDRRKHRAPQSIVRLIEKKPLVGSQLDTRHEDASRTLGASRWYTFRRVTLPAIRPALVAGAVGILSVDKTHILFTTEVAEKVTGSKQFSATGEQVFLATQSLTTGGRSFGGALIGTDVARVELQDEDGQVIDTPAIVEGGGYRGVAIDGGGQDRRILRRRRRGRDPARGADPRERSAAPGVRDGACHRAPRLRNHHGNGL